LQLSFIFAELNMSIEFIFRLIGLVVFAIVGVFWGPYFSEMIGSDLVLLYTVIWGLVGALFGLVVTPFITILPARGLRRLLGKVPPQTILIGMTGLMLGLLVAALLSFPLSSLPGPVGDFMPLIGLLLCSYFGVILFVARQEDILNLLRINQDGRLAHLEGEEDSASSPGQRTILLDTSVIIDGRIADIARTGFLVGSLLIPRFVLNELQYIADSSDGLRRQRGRRGMEVLSQLQKDASIPVRISDIDVEGVREVDEKLVVLARQLRAHILTNDYNLNRVAELQGVTVLNVNDLANAVKSVVLPGEMLFVNLIQEGRESAQGVAYLDDGTMVVVEDGREWIGTERNVTVTKVLQTSAGRMIFARLDAEQT
jgi:uncharacterized protein YacL